MKHPEDQIFLESDRSLLSVKGKDARLFLNRLLTQAVDGKGLQYGALLNSAGRLISDVMIFPQDREISYVLQIAREVSDVVLHSLRRYRLRDALDIEDVTQDYQSLWSPHGGNVSQALGGQDPRGAFLGKRWIVATGDGGGYTPHNFQDSSWRFDHGIPVMGRDFISGRTFPLEANLDALGAIDWQKGCYPGQELTARTHYTGVVRKRFLPVRFQDVVSQGGVLKTPTGKDAGQITSTVEGGAMALVRLDVWEEDLLTGPLPVVCAGIAGEITIPPYLKEKITLLNQGDNRL